MKCFLKIPGFSRGFTNQIPLTIKPYPIRQANYARQSKKTIELIRKETVFDQPYRLPKHSKNGKFAADSETSNARGFVRPSHWSFIIKYLLTGNYLFAGARAT
jgi:hypothetical protein